MHDAAARNEHATDLAHLGEAVPAPASPRDAHLPLFALPASTGADTGPVPDGVVEPKALCDAPELAPRTPGSRRRAPLLDPGWLWLGAGITLVCFTLVLPAQRDLEEARFYRDRVRAAEEHREQRLTRYSDYLGSLGRADESLILSLAAMQLNKAPQGTDLLVSGHEIAGRTASVFSGLEPPPLVLPERAEKPRSLLERWTEDDRTRLWLLAGGSLAILIGLLPPTRRV